MQQPGFAQEEAVKSLFVCMVQEAASVSVAPTSTFRSKAWSFAMNTVIRHLAATNSDRLDVFRIRSEVPKPTWVKIPET